MDGFQEWRIARKRLAAMGREVLWGKRPAPPVPIPGDFTNLRFVFKEICDGFDSSEAALHAIDVLCEER